MPDLSNLYTALKNADAQGDAAAAKRLAAYIKQQLGQSSPTPAATFKKGYLGLDGLRQQAIKAGWDEEDINTTLETDKLIGAPPGASLAQLWQESKFKNVRNTSSPNSRASGVAQFTGVAIDELLYGRAAKDGQEKAYREQVRESLLGSHKLSLQFHRKLLERMRSRNPNANWLQLMEDYNGHPDEKRQYVRNIKTFLGVEGD